MNEENRKNLFKEKGFKCEKCGFYSPIGKGLEINELNQAVLCSICNVFSPNTKENFKDYLIEKLNWQDLESFRRFGINKASHNPHKQGMLQGAKQGKLMARPAFGYKVIAGELIPDEENRENVRLIFEEFNNGRSLNQISKQYGISVNGIKKVLKNFTYLGKVKFAGSIVQGTHIPLISSELFNNVQRRFESLKK